MAALPDRYDEPVVDLRRISADRLDPLLEEETAAWRTDLDWDFHQSADLVRRFVHMQALNGFALMSSAGGSAHVAGYSYYVCEEGKGLIGDLYLLREHRTIPHENALLAAALDAIWHTPGIKRVEAQLMMLSSPLDRVVPQQNRCRCHQRHFMEAPLAPVVHLPAKPQRGISIGRWSNNRHNETARLIANAYEGHIDGQINDQYRSPAGARRFLTNIVQYPGCGTFFAPASYAATTASGDALCGISLASLVAADVGHITQVCVAPSHQGTGLGYELVRQSLLALAAHGCRMVSLTVTGQNEAAVRLYRRMGFTTLRDFAAFIWENGRA
jgi:ribosomal protein S18 acetylase RimI-like enzyme